MEYVVIVAVCFFSSVVGAICGIGGGVIIKPVLDATGVVFGHGGYDSFLSVGMYRAFHVSGVLVQELKGKA